MAVMTAGIADIGVESCGGLKVDCREGSGVLVLTN
jgi:hypothetical protein